MATDTRTPATARGGSFLLDEATPAQVFTPEDLSDEQRMIRDTARDFMRGELLPRLPEILKLRYETTRELMRKAGELGLLGLEVPEEYGGLGLDKVSGCLVSEQAGVDGSFAVSFTGHTGIGSLPIVYFGTPEQKQKYLPRLASGEWIGSYSLSEASSASDAMNARARAVLSPDGSEWILNGEKMWLSNAGFADLYITFAKVDGEHFTAFIIDKDAPGVSLGAEEKKTGLKGSSTRPLILQDARIPKANLLGEIGKGHKIAFNILNIGRFKLGAGTTGGCKEVLRFSVEYARSRTAFGRPIAEFGLIQQKLGEMAILAYASESVVYRTAGLIDQNLAGASGPLEILGRIEEYAAECSIVKVFCSEVLDRVVDEGVQLFGGAGYVEDYPAERHWRDARVNRIFEGTNEINRLLIPGRLLKKDQAGELGLLARAKELAAGAATARSASGVLGEETALLAGARDVAVLGLGLAAKRFGKSLTEQQEVLAHFADIAIQLYATESALLRARKRAESQGEAKAGLVVDAVRCWASDALDRIETSARRLLAACAQGEELKAGLAALSQQLGRVPADTVALRRRVAAAALEAEGYPLG
jgi:alkylation response protein AidB-like acyl-CoA dehydrogenase